MVIRGSKNDTQQNPGPCDATNSCVKMNRLSDTFYFT